MKIVVIGTGHVAVVLSVKLKAAGHRILQVFGRNRLAAAVLADACDASTCASWDDITPNAELYIIAVADQALTGNAIHLAVENQLVVHTAGAVSIDVLKGMSSSYGVLYPLQTIRKEVVPTPAIPFMIDANTAAGRETLAALASTISQKVVFANDTQRLQYHLCAVITNNFSNYLYVLAEDYCQRQGLDFTNLLPLLAETSRRLQQFSPRQVQTGPAVRGDGTTIQRHIQLLENEPALFGLYKMFSDQVRAFNW
ncbi:MAG: Rossmann-like and DUF2520 domain-containing protein [Bacteroidota bacterium]